MHISHFKSFSARVLSVPRTYKEENDYTFIGTGFKSKSAILSLRLDTFIYISFKPDVKHQYPSLQAISGPVYLDTVMSVIIDPSFLSTGFRWRW